MNLDKFLGELEGILKRNPVCEEREGSCEVSLFSDKHPYIGKYVLVRTYSAGVHTGILEGYDFNTYTIYLKNTRRIYKWEGAFTLSEISVDGIKDGKISKEIPENMITKVEEIMPCSPYAEKNLRNFKPYEI
jgi:hypothetical protein